MVRAGGGSWGGMVDCVGRQANSNVAMLAIHDQLGFTPTDGRVMWQAHADQLVELI